MDAQDDKQRILEGYRLFQNGDIGSLLALFHDDAEWIGPEASTVPFAGNFHGKGEVAQFFAKLGASVQPTRFVLKDVIAEGDKVVVTGEATWLVKSTGVSYDNPWVDVFTMRDGKAVRVEAYYDTSPAERAFGANQAGQAASPPEMRH